METVTVAGGRVVLRCGTQVHLDVSETIRPLRSDRRRRMRVLARVVISTGSRGGRVAVRMGEPARRGCTAVLLGGRRPAVVTGELTFQLGRRGRPGCSSSSSTHRGPRPIPCWPRSSPRTVAWAWFRSRSSGSTCRRGAAAGCSVSDRRRGTEPGPPGRAAGGAGAARRRGHPAGAAVGAGRREHARHRCAGRGRRAAGPAHPRRAAGAGRGRPRRAGDRRAARPAAVGVGAAARVRAGADATRRARDRHPSSCGCRRRASRTRS